MVLPSAVLTGVGRGHIPLQIGHLHGDLAVLRLEHVQLQAVGVVVVGPLLVRAHGDDAVRAGHQRQGQVAVGLPAPGVARHRLAREDIRPFARGQVVVHMAVGVHHRGHQQVRAQHVLGVAGLAGDAVRELQQHGPQHGHALFMGLHRRAVQVGHQPVLQAGEALHDLVGLLVEQPRHPVAAGAVQAAVAGQQAEGGPALVHVGGGGLLEAGDVVAPEGEAGMGDGQAAAQGLGHAHEGRAAVAVPVHRELLAAHGGAAGEHHRVALPAVLLDALEHHLVVEIGVIVVHPQRVAAVEVFDAPHRDALAEVGLEGVHAHVHQRPQLAAVPFPGLGVGHVQDRQARLPQVGLPDVAVLLQDEVALLHALVEHAALLGDVGVDPAADVQPPGLQLLQQALRVREHVGVPGQVGQVVVLHPEAVEVEHAQGDVPLGHAVDEGRDGLFVVAGGEGGGQPQPEAPGRGQRGPAGEGGVPLQYALGVAAVDHVVGHALALLAELHPLHLLAGHLEADVAAALHQHAIAPVGHVEGHVLVGQLAGGAAVAVPDVHHLAVLHVGGEALAQAVHPLAHVQVQRFDHVVLARGLAVGVGHGVVFRLGQQPVVAGVGDPPALPGLADRGLRPAALEGVFGLGLGDDGLDRALVQLKVGAAIHHAPPVLHLHADHVRHGRGEGDGQRRVVHHPAPPLRRHRGADDPQGAFGDGGVKALNRKVQVVLRPVQPVAVGEFHRRNLR